MPHRPDAKPAKRTQDRPTGAHVGVWTPPRIAVSVDAAKESIKLQALELAAAFGLEFMTEPRAGIDLLLVVTRKGLELREYRLRAPGPVIVDFVTQARRHFRFWNGFFKQPFAKAVGARALDCPVVWDVTAGLGRDAWLLACLGCRVTAIERSPVLGAMLRDGLARAAEDSELRAITEHNFSILSGDAVEILSALPPEEAPDVVYLDPMFTWRKKSALPKKEMVVLRRLVGDDPDSGELFEAAQRVARRRVVVKRLRRAPPIRPGRHTAYVGKIVRYDVYMPPRVVPSPEWGYGVEGEDEIDLEASHDAEVDHAVGGDPNGWATDDELF